MPECPVCQAALASDPRLSQYSTRAFCRSCLSVLKRELPRDDEERASPRLVVDIAGAVVRRTLERLDRAEREGTLKDELFALRRDAAYSVVLALSLVAERIAAAMRGTLRLRFDIELPLRWDDPVPNRGRPPVPLGFEPPATRGWRFAEMQPVARRAVVTPFDTLVAASTADHSGQLLVPKPTEWRTDPAVLTDGTRVEALRSDGASILFAPPELSGMTSWFPVRVIQADVSLLEPY